MQSRSAAFLRGRRLGYAFNASWRASSMKRLRTNCLWVSILYYMPVLSSYVCDHAALRRMSANADFSTPLKCLASGKKSIEQLRPSVPRQTLALELLVVYCFCILLAYPCALYYGMLILSRAHGACPTPLDVSYQQWICLTLWSHCSISSHELTAVPHKCPRRASC